MRRLRFRRQRRPPACPPGSAHRGTPNCDIRATRRHDAVTHSTDSRCATPDTNRAVNPSTANLEQLRRTFAEVAAMRPRPKFIFLAGDLVFGYTNSQPELEAQLVAWRALYEASPLFGTNTKMVPIPGNHEV